MLFSQFHRQTCCCCLLVSLTVWSTLKLLSLMGKDISRSLLSLSFSSSSVSPLLLSLFPSHTFYLSLFPVKLISRWGSHCQRLQKWKMMKNIWHILMVRTAMHFSLNAVACGSHYPSKSVFSSEKKLLFATSLLHPFLALPLVTFHSHSVELFLCYGPVPILWSHCHLIVFFPCYRLFSVLWIHSHVMVPLSFYGLVPMVWTGSHVIFVFSCCGLVPVL